MAEMGDGYGSECHLLRYMGRHRDILDRAILAATGGSSIKWLDYPFDKSRRWLDGEWTGLSFLPDDSTARKAWASWWPRSGRAQNWDAVGKISAGGRDEWLLVEAKAHVSEIESHCAASPKSRTLITRALSETREALGGGLGQGENWLTGYYQYANRLAVLHFLNRHNVAARLLFLYFVGDRRPDAFVCPKDEEGWREALDRQDAAIGLPYDHGLADRVHKIFLPVIP